MIDDFLNPSGKPARLSEKGLASAGSYWRKRITGREPGLVPLGRYLAQGREPLDTCTWALDPGASFLDLPQAKERITVFGAGIGKDISLFWAIKGHLVNLVEIDPGRMEDALWGENGIQDELTKAQARRILSREDARIVLSRIQLFTDYRPTQESTNLVFEAIKEDPQIKARFFAELDRFYPPGVMFFSNTSTIPLSDIFKSVSPERRRVCGGIHYFHRVHQNKGLEATWLPETSTRTKDQIRAMCVRAGKVFLETKRDRPGMIVDRIFVPLLNESVRMMEELEKQGYSRPDACATVDRAACEGLGIGLGPFPLMNATAIHIGWLSAAYLGSTLGSFYAPATSLETQGRRYLESKGTDLWPENGASSDDRGLLRSIGERLKGVVFGVATEILEEGVGDLETIETGTQVCLRWMRGPFRMMNAEKEGVRGALKLVEGVGGRYSGSFSVPLILKERAGTGRSWNTADIRSVKQGRVLTILVNRPHVENALNAGVMAQIHRVLERGIKDPEVELIVNTSRGRKSKVSGFDVLFFYEAIRDKKLDRIRKAVQKYCHPLIDALWTCPKPTLDLINGLVLGGGLEYSLAQRFRVASSRAYFSFPETTLGIHPDLKGIPMAIHRLGAKTARWMILLSPLVDAKAALGLGLVDLVVHPDRLEEAVPTLIAHIRQAQPGGTLSAEGIGEALRALRGPGKPEVDAGIGQEIEAVDFVFADPDAAEERLKACLAGTASGLNVPRSVGQRVARRLRRKDLSVLKSAAQRIKDADQVISQEGIDKALVREEEIMPAMVEVLFGQPGPRRAFARILRLPE